MTTVSIISRSLGGLKVDIDMDNHNDPINAYFSSNGNQLPDNMWTRLTNSTHDMASAVEEVEKENA